MTASTGKTLVNITPGSPVAIACDVIDSGCHRVIVPPAPTGVDGDPATDTLVGAREAIAEVGWSYGPHPDYDGDSDKAYQLDICPSCNRTGDPAHAGRAVLYHDLLQAQEG